MSTRHAIISLLRTQTLTASELARDLDVTRNAIIVPLRQLEAEGIVEGIERKAKRVGKPALEYRVLPGHEDLISKAYPPFAETLMCVASEHLDRDQIEQLLTGVGRTLAKEVDVQSDWDIPRRLQAATSFLDRLGAGTRVDKIEGGSILRSFSCPLGRAVRQEPCVCRTVESFLSDVTGVKVTEKCSRGEELRCKFLIEG